MEAMSFVGATSFIASLNELVGRWSDCSVGDAMLVGKSSQAQLDLHTALKGCELALTSSKPVREGGAVVMTYHL